MSNEIRKEWKRHANLQWNVNEIKSIKSRLIDELEKGDLSTRAPTEIEEKAIEIITLLETIDLSEDFSIKTKKKGFVVLADDMKASRKEKL